MYLTLIVVGIVAAGLLSLIFARRARERQEMQRYSITPEELHMLLASDKPVHIFDVRLPLDLLAHSEIIPGSKRIAPKELLGNTSLIPQDKDSVVYCTCAGEKTSRSVSRQARARHLFRVKFLKGGLEAWKAKGYPVEPYEESFHLDTADLTRSAGGGA